MWLEIRNSLSLFFLSTNLSWVIKVITDLHPNTPCLTVQIELIRSLLHYRYLVILNEAVAINNATVLFDYFYHFSSFLLKGDVPTYRFQPSCAKVFWNNYFCNCLQQDGYVRNSDHWETKNLQKIDIQTTLAMSMLKNLFPSKTQK